jgi:hypothetical protein
MLVLPKHIDMFYISMLLKLDPTSSQTGSVGKVTWTMLFKKTCFNEGKKVTWTINTP